MSIGERLKEAREALKMTQAEFSAIGGVGARAQLTYEKNDRKPDAEYLQKISRLGCDIQYIVMGIRSESTLESYEEELLTALRSSPPDVRMMAISAALGVVRSGELSEKRTIRNEGDYLEQGNKIKNPKG